MKPKIRFLLLFFLLLLALPYIFSSCMRKKNQVMCDGFSEENKKYIPYHIGDSIVFASDSGDRAYLRINFEHFSEPAPSYCYGKYAADCESCNISGARSGTFITLQGQCCVSSMSVSVWEGTNDGKKDGQVNLSVNVGPGFYQGLSYQLLPVAQPIDDNRYVTYHDSLQVAGKWFRKVLEGDFNDTTIFFMNGCANTYYYSIDEGLVAFRMKTGRTFVKQ